MKGYVSVTFTDKQKQELSDLYDKINEFNKKPKEEVFGYTTFTVDKKFLWWKWQGEIKLWEFQCPEELKPFFFDWTYSPECYYFELSSFGEHVTSIYHLVRQEDIVMLGEHLSRALNRLQICGYISINNQL